MSEVAAAVSAIRRRWGSEALRPASTLDVDRPEPLVSGLPELDALTGLGGLPCGRITGFSGRVGSGTSSLLQQLTANASRRMVTVYLDTISGLDPAFLLSLGADLENLYVARPATPGESAEAIRTLLRAGLPALALQLDGRSASADALQQVMPELATLAARAGTLFLVASTTYPDRSPLAYASSLWFQLERVGWMEWHGDIVGIRTRVGVLRSRVGRPGPEAVIDLHYPALGVPRFLEGGSGVPGMQPLAQLVSADPAARNRSGSLRAVG